MSEKIPLAPPLARRFVRYILGFFVSMAVGLAPFLGNVNVPGFRSLLSVMPFQITAETIPLSAFLMGLIAVALQFYAGEKISLPFLRKAFGIAFLVIAAGFLLFVILRDQFTVGVRRGSSRVTVLISSSPTGDCGNCENPKDSPADCISELSFAEEAIERCWGREPLMRRGLFLKLSYMVLTGGVGVLIGILLLQVEALQRKKRAKAQASTVKATPKRRRRSPKPAAPPAPEKPAQAPPPKTDPQT